MRPRTAISTGLALAAALALVAGHDVGDTAALDALAGQMLPAESAAQMAVAEAATDQLAALTPQLLAQLEDQRGDAADLT